MNDDKLMHADVTLPSLAIFPNYRVRPLNVRLTYDYYSPLYRKYTTALIFIKGILSINGKLHLQIKQEITLVVN